MNTALSHSGVHLLLPCHGGAISEACRLQKLGLGADPGGHQKPPGSHRLKLCADRRQQTAFDTTRACPEKPLLTVLSALSPELAVRCLKCSTEHLTAGQPEQEWEFQAHAGTRTQATEQLSLEDPLCQALLILSGDSVSLPPTALHLRASLHCSATAAALQVQPAQAASRAQLWAVLRQAASQPRHDRAGELVRQVAYGPSDEAQAQAAGRPQCVSSSRMEPGRGTAAQRACDASAHLFSGHRAR